MVGAVIDKLTLAKDLLVVDVDLSLSPSSSVLEFNDKSLFANRESPGDNVVAAVASHVFLNLNDLSGLSGTVDGAVFEGGAGSHLHIEGTLGVGNGLVGVRKGRVLGLVVAFVGPSGKLGLLDGVREKGLHGGAEKRHGVLGDFLV